MGIGRQGLNPNDRKGKGKSSNYFLNRATDCPFLFFLWYWVPFKKKKQWRTTVGNLLWVLEVTQGIVWLNLCVVYDLACLVGWSTAKQYLLPHCRFSQPLGNNLLYIRCCCRNLHNRPHQTVLLSWPLHRCGNCGHSCCCSWKDTTARQQSLAWNPPLNLHLLECPCCVHLPYFLTKMRLLVQPLQEDPTRPCNSCVSLVKEQSSQAKVSHTPCIASAMYISFSIIWQVEIYHLFHIWNVQPSCCYCFSH